MFRIQKLLLAEYQEIYEPVIVENPFTQVTANGLGLRQYHIGLTASKVIFGCDDFDLTRMEDVYYREADPEIETFQLVSLMPLQFVKFHFYRKRNRDIMQMTVCDDEESPMYFEFGGYIYKSLFWNTWRERISTLRLADPLIYHITGSSPFSSTDVLADDEICHAVIHPIPLSARSSNILSLSSCHEY